MISDLTEEPSSIRARHARRSARAMESHAEQGSPTAVQAPAEDQAAAAPVVLDSAWFERLLTEHALGRDVDEPMRDAMWCACGEIVYACGLGGNEWRRHLSEVLAASVAGAPGVGIPSPRQVVDA